MTDETAIKNSDTPIPPGGAELRGLDLTNPRDVQTVSRAIKCWPKRWRGLTPELKDKIAASLDKGLAVASELADSPDEDTRLKAVAQLMNGVKTGVAMEGQEQTDQWNLDKNQRLDEGKLTENHGGVQFVIKQAERPEPPAGGD